jgi:hypothetical protein
MLTDSVTLRTLYTFIDSKLPGASETTNRSTAQMIGNSKTLTKDLLKFLIGKIFALCKQHDFSQMIEAPELVPRCSERYMEDEPELHGYHVEMKWNSLPETEFGIRLGLSPPDVDSFSRLGPRGAPAASLIPITQVITYWSNDHPTRESERHDITKNYESTINVRNNNIEEAAREISEHLFQYYLPVLKERKKKKEEAMIKIGEWAAQLRAVREVEKVVEENKDLLDLLMDEDADQ